MRSQVVLLLLIAATVVCLFSAHGRTTQSHYERARSGHDIKQHQHQHQHQHASTHAHSSSHESIPPSSKPLKPLPWSASSSIYTGSFAHPISSSDAEHHNKSISHHNDQLPKHWDWCDTGGDEARSFCTSSWNQHIPQYCGSCYIHGALHAANDRIKLLLDGKHDVQLARQVILNCGPSQGLGQACDGGEVYDVFEFMYRYGLPDESCQQYTASAKHRDTHRCDPIDVCMNCMPSIRNETKMECWEVLTPIRYYIKSYGLVSGEKEIMREIYERGPITCAFASVDDFDYNYRGGIYVDYTNASDSNHDVEVVGWGEDEETGMKYWKARNSCSWRQGRSEMREKMQKNLHETH